MSFLRTEDLPPGCTTNPQTTVEEMKAETCPPWPFSPWMPPAARAIAERNRREAAAAAPAEPDPQSP